jgi:hypothetical protein
LETNYTFNNSFTIGHTVLLLSVFGIIAVKVNVVELLIPITILITAFFNLFTAGKSNKKESINLIFFVTLSIIHGLDFLIILKRSLAERHIKVIALEFAVGIEAANYCSFIVLIISYVVQTVLGSLKGIGPW